MQPGRIGRRPGPFFAHSSSHASGAGRRWSSRACPPPSMSRELRAPCCRSRRRRLRSPLDHPRRPSIGVSGRSMKTATPRDERAQGLVAPSSGRPASSRSACSNSVGDQRVLCRTPMSDAQARGVMLQPRLVQAVDRRIRSIHPRHHSVRLMAGRARSRRMSRTQASPVSRRRHVVGAVAVADDDGAEDRSPNSLCAASALREGSIGSRPLVADRGPCQARLDRSSPRSSCNRHGAAPPCSVREDRLGQRLEHEALQAVGQRPGRDRHGRGVRCTGRKQAQCSRRAQKLVP